MECRLPSKVLWVISPYETYSGPLLMFQSCVGMEAILESTWELLAMLNSTGGFRLRSKGQWVSATFKRTVGLGCFQKYCGL